MNRLELATAFRLNDCAGCRTCSESCPSCRNGGIDPEETVSALLSDRTVQKIWMCLQCRRCTAACPQDIDVAGTILALREVDAKDGNAPDKIKKAASALLKDGCISVPRGRMEALRKELGLDDAAADEDAIRELNRILKAAGFGYE